MSARVVGAGCAPTARKATDRAKVDCWITARWCVISPPGARCAPPPFPPSVSSGFRSTSLIRNSAPLGSYSRSMPRALWWWQGGGAVSYERGTPVHESRTTSFPGP